MSAISNYTTAIFLVNDNVRCVRVNYDGSTSKDHTFKTFDHSLKVDDLVLVPTDTRHGFTVCKIVEINVDIDYDSSTQFKWVVGKVDLDSYEKVLEQEKIVVEAVKEAMVQKKRSDLLEAMNLSNNSKLKALALVNAGPSSATSINDTPTTVDAARMAS